MGGRHNFCCKYTNASFTKSPVHQAHEQNKMNNILIVDDEEELCELLSMFLTKQGYTVQVAHTIAQCKAKVSNNNFDLVFMDNNLPDGMGWDYAPRLVEEHPQTYIALISAYKPTQVKMPAGAKYSIIEKPLKFSKISEELKHIFHP